MSGRPLRFIVTAGHVSNITQARDLLDGQTGKAVLADKPYHSNALRVTIKATLTSRRSHDLDTMNVDPSSWFVIGDEGDPLIVVLIIRD